MQVFFYEAFDEEAHALRACLPARVHAGFSSGTIAECRHDAPPARLISTRTQSFLPETWDGRVQAVLSRSTGFDHLLTLRKRFTHPISLGHLPLYCHTAVAEHALMAILVLARRLPQQLSQFARFDRDGITGHELGGRTVAVFGMGQIGGEVARLCSGIGMKVLGVDPVRSDAPVRWVEPEVGLQADVIVCAMNLTADNHGYFNGRIQHARRGALFINISRGELSSSTVLLEALEDGQLSGVALDVYDHERSLAEPLRAGTSPDDAEALAALALSRRSDAICTPHNAFNTAEAVTRKAEHSVLQVLDWLERGAFRWPVG